MNDESSYEANRKVRFTRSHHGRLGLRIGWELYIYYKVYLYYHYIYYVLELR